MQTRKKRASSEVAIDLQIGGEVWHRVASLANSGPDDRHFVLTTDERGATTVRFGDGAHGARLPAGADAIVAAYRSSKRFVAVVQQEGRVIVDNDWRERVPVGLRSSVRRLSRGGHEQRRPDGTVTRAGGGCRGAREPVAVGDAVPAGGIDDGAGGGCERVGGLRGRRSLTPGLDGCQLISVDSAATQSLDPLVGALQQRWGNDDAERFCGLQVDHQVELGRLLHRHVGGLRALENPVDEGGRAAPMPLVG